MPLPGCTMNRQYNMGCPASMGYVLLNIDLELGTPATKNWSSDWHRIKEPDQDA